MGIKCACDCGGEVSTKAAANGWKYIHGHKPKKGNGQNVAGGGRKLQRSAAIHEANGYGPMIADLEAKRDKLERAIAAIKELV